MCCLTDLKQNEGTFLTFLCSSNWNEWNVSKQQSRGPSVEFKVCGRAMWISNVIFQSTCHAQRLLIQTTENGEAKLQIFGKIQVICKVYDRRLTTNENYTVPNWIRTIVIACFKIKPFGHWVKLWFLSSLQEFSGSFPISLKDLQFLIPISLTTWGRTTFWMFYL